MTELVSAGKEVVLVVHSYTGLPGGEAPKGLSKKDQEAKGLKGGLIRYVVINGFVTPQVVEMMIKGAQMMNPTAFDVVESLKENGHCFMISHLEWTAEALRRAAGENF